jgi:hypothetical protein
MRRFIIFLVLPWFLGATKYAGEFQELGAGARILAMGGAGIAQGVDPSVLYFNPAGTLFILRGIHLMHAENFGGLIKNEFGSLVIPRTDAALGLGFQLLTASGIKFTTLPDTTRPPGIDNPPYAYDTVAAKDAIVYLNAARGNGMFAFGGNLKIYYRDLVSISGFGGGLDLGVDLNLEYLKFGLAVRDFVLSPIVWSNGTRETIASKLALGVAPVIPLEKLNSQITLECDFLKYLDRAGFAVNVGFELAYHNFLFGRLGINQGNFTLGAGLRYKKFILDYAFVTNSFLKDSNKFSAGLEF